MSSAAASMQVVRGKAVGALIVNADDWGRDVSNTNAAYECIRAGTLSSASAMVFMEDSERAAEIARASRIDTGLHLNLTSPFTTPRVPSLLAERQRRIARYLSRNRLAQVIYHPGLAKSFEYVVAAQIGEYQRLYGETPRRIDGHHHMHLCENVLAARLLPPRIIVRRNFSFATGEKGWANRLYRTFVDRRIAARHILTDYFFSLIPFERARLGRICGLAAQSVVEVGTHPVKAAEFEFLIRGGFLNLAPDVSVARRFEVCS